MEQVVTDPYKLTLSDTELQAKVDAELVRILHDVVSANSDRDYDLRQLRMQLEGWSQPNMNDPWPGACNVEASVSREVHLTLCAAISAAARQHPYATIEAIRAEDVDAASQQESYLNLKAQQCGFEAALKQVIYVALEGRYAPMHVGYETPINRYFELNAESGEIELHEEAQEPRLTFRSIDPWDIYAYPVTATGPQLRHGCALLCERMSLTEQDLIKGVRDEGYDSGKVSEMLRQGPAPDIAEEEESRTDEFDRSGVKMDSRDRSAGVWYCYQVIGRMPLIADEDGEATIPEVLQFADCLWMVCPALGIVFKQAYSSSPEGFRPYVNFHAVKKPNRWIGEGPVSLISSLHEEMTSVIRFGINNMNIEASPTLVADERWKMKYPQWTIAPGRILPRMAGDQVGPKPLQWDVRSQQLVPVWLDRLDAWAHRMIASEGMNSALSGKVRKAAEVHFNEGMQQTKFDLFLSNIQEGIVEVFEIMRALCLQHMDEGGDSAYANGQSVEINRDRLSREVRFFAQATSDSLTPAARMARQQVTAQIVMSYWNGVPQWMQLGCLTYMWHLHHRLLTLNNERAPERYLGPNPEQQMAQGAGQPSPEVVQALSALLGSPSESGLPVGQGGSPGSPAPGSQNGLNFGAEQMMGGGMGQSLMLAGAAGNGVG